MEVFEAAEHATLHRHGLAEEARVVELPLQSQALAEYEAQHADELRDLNARAPHGGRMFARPMDDPQDHKGRSGILTGIMVAYIVIGGLILLVPLLLFLSILFFAGSH